MRIYNGTSIKINYPENDVFSRETQIIEIERKTSDVDNVEVNNNIYQFYKDKIKIDVTDIFRSKIGKVSIFVKSGFDDEELKFTSYDGFRVSEDVYPGDMIIPGISDVLFFSPTKITVEVMGYSIWETFAISENFEVTPTIIGARNFRILNSNNEVIHHFNTTSDFCGQIESLRWKSKSGQNYKTFYLYVDKIVEGSDESIELMNDFDGYNVRKNRYTDFHLLLPSASFINHHYFKDLIYSNDVLLGNEKGVLVDASEFELPTDKTTFKPKDLRFKIRVKKYAL